MSFTTADLCDRHEAGVRVVAPGFRDYGGLPCFSGPIATLKVHEDNSLVRAALEKPGEGRVLVVDGGGSLVLCAGRRCPGRPGTPEWLGRAPRVWLYP